MCLECEKKNHVQCIKNVYLDQSEVFTAGKAYGVFSWYDCNEDIYNFSAMNNNEEEHIISDGTEDDIKEFTKDEWFKEHFKLITN